MKMKRFSGIVVLSLLLLQSKAFSFQENYFNISEDVSFSLTENEFLENFIDLKDESFLAISLGCNCWTAAHLSNYGLRKRAFPFDWAISSIEDICSLIQSNFYAFLDTRYFYISNGFAISTMHDMRLVHDFHISNWGIAEKGIAPLNDFGRQEYKGMVEQYQRRISRFYSTFELGIPIYLFRWEIGFKDPMLLVEGYYKLYNLLRTKFPNNEIHLICVQSNGSGIDQDWGHPYIKHFSVTSDIMSLLPLKGIKDPEWERVFLELGLLNTD